MSAGADAVVEGMLAFWAEAERVYWCDYGGLRLPPESEGAQVAIETFVRARGRAYLEGAFGLLNRLLEEAEARNPAIREQAPLLLAQFISGPCRSTLFGGWKDDEAATAARLSMFCDRFR